jgi:beta-galactosidase
MKNKHLPFLFSIVVVSIFGLKTGSADDRATAQPRSVGSFDRDWKFYRGDAKGAEQPAFDDSAWRSLDIPHDFMIEGGPNSDPTKKAQMEGPFDKNSPAGNGGGYLNGGIAWYRKTFTLPESDKGQRISILFDGAYMDSDVYLNGRKLGNHPYGFTSFSYDLTPQAKFGADKNVLAVRLNIMQPCCRWYSGGGLYRHVWLIGTQPVHVAQWGTYITTPKAGATGAEVDAKTEIENADTAATAATLTTILLDPSGKEVARKEDTQQVAPGSSVTYNQSMSLASAQLWSCESPVLYHAVSEVRVNGTLTDSYTTPFGIRTVEFIKDNGFLLNGQRVQIKGVCDHHDLGCLRSAALKRGFERQLQILKGMGCNALRTSHNPPSPELLDLCDQMGFLVMDECFDEWKLNKTKNGYGRFFNEWSQKDLVSMLHRDRNHPSIIIWSIGNEVTEGYTAGGAKTAQPLTDTCHREDPSRLVTSALQQPDKSLDLDFEKALDVFGCNYKVNLYNDPRLKGIMPLLGSETSSQVDTRGEYGLRLDGQGNVQVDPEPPGQVSCYDLFRPFWAQSAETDLISVKNATWNAGEYCWTGFDYIGEPTPYGWPSRSSYFGINDLCGFPKDRYYLYKSQWSSEPLVHILPSSWNWAGFEGKSIPVRVFTNADTVELFLNGTSLGVKNFPADTEVTTETKKNKDKPDTVTQYPSLHLAWSVPYAPGVLKAVAKKNGQVVATDEIHTAGAPAQITMTPDRDKIVANGQDLSYIKVTILDKDGNVCPDADNEIKFSLDGSAGILAGLDNGDATNHEPFQGTQHKAFHGLALAVVKSGYDATGALTLTASADGLTSASTTVTVTAP